DFDPIAPGSGGAGPIGGSADASAPGTGGVTGNGTGAVTGNPPFGEFSTIKAADGIGKPAAPGETAVYLLSSAMSCDELHPTGWEDTMPTPTSVLEIVLAGKTPYLYAVQTTQPPTNLDAFVMDHYAPGGGSGTSNLSAQEGTITLFAVNA